jgi:hypothetical protein
MPSSASSASSTSSANKLNTLLRNGECNAGTHDTQPATHAHTSILARWVHINIFVLRARTRSSEAAKQRSSEAVKQVFCALANPHLHFFDERHSWLRLIPIES